MSGQLYSEEHIRAAIEMAVQTRLIDRVLLARVVVTWLQAHNCPDCNGLGSEFRENNGNAYMAKCPACGGTGRAVRTDAKPT